MKKKILFLSPLPPPHYGSAMSSEMCLNILKDSNEFEVKNIKLNYSRDMDDIGKINLGKIRGIFHVKKQIKEKIKKFQPDLIYFVPATYGLGLFRDSSFVSIIKKLTNKKIIFHVRSRIEEKHWNNKLFRSRYKKMFAKQRVIVLDKSLKKDLHGLIDEESFFILPNAIKNEVNDTKLKKILLKRNKEKQFNVLFLSHMNRTKGWFKLLQACSILHKKDINFICNFVGGWWNKEDEGMFYNFIKTNNLEKNVFYLGKKSGKDKNEILARSKLLVYPTELDTFGRVIIEAMMFGLPVIANGITSIPTTIQHKKTGFVLKHNSPKEISDYIWKLIPNQRLREKMGIAGRKRFLEEYEIESYKKRFLKIFEKL